MSCSLIHFNLIYIVLLARYLVNKFFQILSDFLIKIALELFEDIFLLDHLIDSLGVLINLNPITAHLEKLGSEFESNIYSHFDKIRGKWLDLSKQSLEDGVEVRIRAFEVLHKVVCFNHDGIVSLMHLFVPLHKLCCQNRVLKLFFPI
jgi:hypothetical protein